MEDFLKELSKQHKKRPPLTTVICKKETSLDDALKKIVPNGHLEVSFKLQQCRLEKFRFPQATPHLVVVTATSCTLGTLPSGAFRSLLALEKLTITRCRIETFQPDVFAGIPTLRDLSFTQNEVKTLPQELLFHGSSSLRNLDLRSNAFKDLKIIHLDALGELVSLNLSCNEFSAIPARCFQNLRKLRRLCLHDNRIERIDGDEAFEGLQDLPVLYLEGNRLQGVQQGVLDRLASLEMLTLDANPISDLVHVDLTGLEKLQCLNLSNDSALVGLSAASLAGIPRGIGVLNLDHNMIGEIENETFQEFRTLVRLNLSCNRIRNLPELVFVNQMEVMDLDLSGNVIEVLTEKSFFKLVGLSSLSLRGNRLRTLPSDVFRPLFSLTCLDLSGNKLGGLEKRTFDRVPTLKILRLEDNRLEALEAGMFGELKDLVELDLGNNKLKTFEISKVLGLPSKLCRLSLENNYIDALSVEDFTPFGSLRVLRLNGNKLKENVLEKFNKKYAMEATAMDQRL